MLSIILQAMRGGLAAQQFRINTISNNIANLNTVAFKRSRSLPLEGEYLSLPLAWRDPATDAMPTSSLWVGTGTEMVATRRVFSQGALRQTERPLDLAIVGAGFFIVRLSNDSLAYTRDGSFQLDGQGRLVTSRGYLLLPQITVPEDGRSLAIDASGQVTVIRDEGEEAELLGQIQLARFSNPASLVSLGGNLYQPSAASGSISLGEPRSDGFGKLASGHLEGSNVELIEELVGLVQARRAYQITLRALQALDDMWAGANGLRP